MISPEEIIYYFTKNYLSTAMECSICRENYDMTDDYKFLNDYMECIVALFDMARDAEFSLDNLNKILADRKKQALTDFYNYMGQKVVEFAIAKVNAQALKDKTLLKENFTNKINSYWDSALLVSEEIREHPTEFLRFVRTKEEQFN